jgi:hypothetical protein
MDSLPGPGCPQFSFEKHFVIVQLDSFFNGCTGLISFYFSSSLIFLSLEIMQAVSKIGALQ